MVVLVSGLHAGDVGPEGGTLDGVQGQVGEVVCVHLHCHLLRLGQAVNLGELKDKRKWHLNQIIYKDQNN